MPRPRKPENAWMPPDLYCGKGRYYVRKGGAEVRIAPANAKRQAVLKAYAEHLRSGAAREPKAPTAKRLRDLASLYFASPIFGGLAPSTQKDARRSIESVLRYPLKSGQAFGEVPAADITIGVIRRWLDKRAQQAAVRGNRELAYLSAMYSWAVQREHAAANPCKGVSRTPEQHRQRYVTDAEFAQRYEIAGAMGRPDVQGMMQLAYLCRLRESEAIKIIDSPKHHILPTGVLAARGKGSKTQIIEWSPALTAAVDLLRSIPRRLPTTRLVVSPHTGRPLTLAAFASAWQLLRAAAAQQGHATDWTFHDLKAKGVSDFEGDKHAASGHKTHAMTEVYDRRLSTIKSTR